MKRGFVLISTLSIVAILSFLILIINKTVVQDSIKSYIFNESIHKRIQLINYEKFLDEIFKNKKPNINKFFLRNRDLYISVNVILSSSLYIDLSESD